MRTWIDDAVYAAIKSYLRTCSSGGMPDEEVDMVCLHVDAAADLAYFGQVVAQEIRDRNMKLVPQPPK
jgi:hypothetical protein